MTTIVLAGDDATIVAIRDLMVPAEQGVDCRVPCSGLVTRSY